MFNKLKQLLTSNTEPDPPIPPDLPPELISDIDFTIPRTAHFGREVAAEAPCPACKTTLEATYAPFMVALVDRQGNTIDGFVMGDPAIGRFCPNCPTVIVDMEAVENKLDTFEENMDDLPDDYGVAVIGLLDLEKMAELEEQGEEIEEYPIIPFLSPKNRPSGRKKTKKRKTTRKKRR